jgi:autoinducer 2-degrading protein
MFVVTVRFSIKEENRAAFSARMRQQARDSLAAEKNCLRFDILSDPEDPGRIFLYEIYTDKAAFDAHLATAHFLAFKADAQAWIDSKVEEHWSGPWD